MIPSLDVPDCRLAFALSLVLAGCAAPPPAPATAPEPPASAPDQARAGTIEIALAHGSDAEKKSRAQLQRLLARHDLGPWLMTRRVMLDEDAIPHSHPVLTLHTRHLGEDDQLLSTFIHEQMHWLLDAHPAETAAAVAELRALFPDIPVGFPDGARDERSSYEHLLVILLEYRGLEALIGRERAEATFDFWQTDHYRALYRLVRENRSAVEAIRAKHLPDRAHAGRTDVRGVSIGD